MSTPARRGAQKARVPGGAGPPNPRFIREEVLRPDTPGVNPGGPQTRGCPWEKGFCIDKGLNKACPKDPPLSRIDGETQGGGPLFGFQPPFVTIVFLWGKMGKNPLLPLGTFFPNALLKECGPTFKTSIFLGRGTNF